MGVPVTQALMWLAHDAGVVQMNARIKHVKKWQKSVSMVKRRIDIHSQDFRNKCFNYRLLKKAVRN